MAEEIWTFLSDMKNDSMRYDCIVCVGVHWCSLSGVRPRNAPAVLLSSGRGGDSTTDECIQETMRVVFPFYSKPEHIPVPLIQFLKLARG